MARQLGMLLVAFAIWSASAVAADFEGDSGPNELTGTAEPDRMLGFGGRDLIEGEQGDDEIAGGDDSDVLRGEQGDDRVSGGRGNDNVTERRNGNLGDGTYGGEDVLLGRDGRDRLIGGREDDVIRGGKGTDRDTVEDANAGGLVGGRGDDELFGGPDGDELYGGPGRDHLSGGGGGDEISAHIDNTPDEVTCGPGEDLVYADSNDAVSEDCEQVIPGPF